MLLRAGFIGILTSFQLVLLLENSNFTPNSRKMSRPKIKSKFDEYRTTVGDDNSFRKKFRNAVDDYKKGSEKSVKIRLLIILSILVSLFLLFFFI